MPTSRLCVESEFEKTSNVDSLYKGLYTAVTLFSVDDYIGDQSVEYAKQGLFLTYVLYLFEVGLDDRHYDSKEEAMEAIAGYIEDSPGCSSASINEIFDTYEKRFELLKEIYTGESVMSS